ncbi:type IV secretory system conjugative DNA transfer family protein [Streptomyces sp. NBC_00691]|uniref:type IV secretory system conjugative DNA transfer family protein n=1 Tax=Streptomyces sp. NBC_00691 TaxID=2903671 RepID=UPI002E3174A0|nr:type IV secretory system conjugative DNA transfer family protein [Streptomyces sp. NBC_00691]
MMLEQAAPWDNLPDLPGYALPGGGGLLLALLLIAYAMNEKGKGGSSGPNKELNEAIERVVGGAARTIGRYVAGRDLNGEPRSTATWWRSGVLVDDQGGPAAAISAVPSPRAPASALGLPKKPPGRGSRAVRAALAPLRGAWSVTASMGRALAAWTRWPHAARSLIRLAPFLAAWGLWRFPEPAQLALIGAAVVVLLVALTGPGGLTLWEPRSPTDDEIHGPSLFVAVRQVLRLEEGERREKWVNLSPDLSADGARIVVRIPVSWMGGKEAMSALDHIVETRIPGEWVAHWERTGPEHYVKWTRKPKPAERPKLPEYVEWKSTGNRYEVFVGQAIEGDTIVDAVVHTQTATPHWGVAGDTGSGKSTVLYIPIVHGRQHGELIDILDTKRNSLIEAEGHSGVRVHKTVRSCVAAFAEFMVSMMAAEEAQGKYAAAGARDQLVPRTLVIDELPTLIKLAYTWWRHGLKGKGAPPFLEWFSIILLQGRSSNHRIVVGTQQFANTFFGGTMERSQIGTKIIVGQQDRVSWGVAFGQATPVVQYDTDVKGRGAYADKRQAPDGEHLFVRELQPSYITPRVAELLQQCPKAPAWFDAGEMAPWITEEVLEEADLTTAVRRFLPGGEYGPLSLPTVTPGAGGGVKTLTHSSEHVTAPVVTARVTAHVTASAPSAPTGESPEEAAEDAALPRTYSLAEACEEGILPWKHSTARQYKKRGEERGITFPEGVTDGRTTYFTEEELKDWATRFQASTTKK